MSSVISSFKTALETCHRDLQSIGSALSTPMTLDTSLRRLLTESKNHARELLDAAYEVTARLREKENVPTSDIESLEKNVRTYYDYNDADRISRQSLQGLSYHLEETTKLFLSLKPYLTILPAERRNVAAVPTSRRVFIVHGRDGENNKGALKDMLVRFNLEPVILAEQPHRGRHLLEKLLDNTSDVGFVFILMTPDDVGATEDELYEFLIHLENVKWNEENQKEAEFEKASRVFKPRVRQNVMFEYGLCIGSLGKENVCVLVCGEDLEIPSDVLGYGYVRFKKSVPECEDQIRRELEAAGYDIPKK